MNKILKEEMEELTKIIEENSKNLLDINTILDYKNKIFTVIIKTNLKENI